MAGKYDGNLRWCNIEKVESDLTNFSSLVAKSRSAAYETFMDGKYDGNLR